MENEKSHPEARCVNVTINTKRLSEDVAGFWQLYVRYAGFCLAMADWGKQEDREMIRALAEDMKFISTQVVPTVRR